MDDRDVEALREVARVARRAPFHRVGREADLIVRDQVQRPADRVAVEGGEVQRLSDSALTGEGRVAVDQDRQRDRRVMEPHPRRAVGLLGAGPPLDDRIDGLEVARVCRERHGYVARGRRTCPLCAEVVLHVPRAALPGGDDCVDRALAFELAEDRVVAKPQGVRQHVQAAAVRHPEHDFVGTGLRSEIDRLVEHRHEHVEALDRELLASEEGLVQVVLEGLDLR